MAPDTNSAFVGKMRQIFKMFRRQNVVKHSFDSGLGKFLPQRKISDKGTADQFLSMGIGFGGRTLFPYRSGMAHSFDRQGRYALYIEQDFDPYANNALDLIADFVCDEDENGQIMTINCENEKMKSILESLFFDVLRIDNRLWSITRGLAKFGDYFCLINWHPKYGVMDLLPLPVHEIEREEGFDAKDPMAIRFKWTTHPHRRINNFEMVHFRLFGNDALLPYGSSILESSRRSFQQYLMMLDAMMIYRMVRAPERLVFYIEMGATPPDQVEQVLQEQKNKLKTATIVDASNSIQDMRYDPMITTEDYFLPKRGDNSSRIEQLPGGTIQGDTEDIELAVNRYISGLKVPKPYLDYNEEWAKANIANMDIRFGKTIHRVQNAMIQELHKVGIIHLLTVGFSEQEVFDWDIEMSNPSTISELQKLEIWEKRLSIITSAKSSEVLSTDFIYDDILHLSDQDKEKILRGMIKDKMWEQLREKAAEKFISNLEEKSGGGEEGQESEGGKEESADKEGGGEGAKKGLVVPESKSSLGIPQNKKVDLMPPDTEEQVKRVTPNKGDALEDPYDRDWLKKTATNIMEDDDALEEAGKFVLKVGGKIIVPSYLKEAKEFDRKEHSQIVRSIYIKKYLDEMKEKGKEIYNEENHTISESNEEYPVVTKG